jgi:hypothetical protein
MSYLDRMLHGKQDQFSKRLIHLYQLNHKLLDRSIFKPEIKNPDYTSKNFKHESNKSNVFFSIGSNVREIKTLLNIHARPIQIEKKRRKNYIIKRAASELELQKTGHVSTSVKQSQS